MEALPDERKSAFHQFAALVEVDSEQVELPRVSTGGDAKFQPSAGQ